MRSVVILFALSVIAGFLMTGKSAVAFAELNFVAILQLRQPTQIEMEQMALPQKLNRKLAHSSDFLKY